MELLIVFVILALAVHRLTVLVIDDKITEPFRNKLFEKWDPQDTWTYLFTCPWCVSIWLAGIVVAGYVLIPTATLIGCAILAFPSIAGLIEERR